MRTVVPIHSLSGCWKRPMDPRIKSAGDGFAGGSGAVARMERSAIREDIDG